MKKEFFGKWGCYVGYDCAKLEVTYPDSWEDERLSKEMDEYISELALEVTSGWYGMHGFEEDREDYESDEEFWEAEQMAINEAADGYYEPWDDLEHAPKCTYGSSTQPDTMEVVFK